MLTHSAMLRVGEVAALRYCDVVDADGERFPRFFVFQEVGVMLPVSLSVEQ